jgi:6-bladed beta-propeller
MRVRVVGVFALTAVIAALDTASSSARPSTRVWAQRADTMVKMAGRPLHAGVATLIEEISIGVADGAEEYMFGDVADIAVARDGSIYVYDRKVPAIRKYDVKGKYARTIGRKGQGPGEYLSGSGLAVLRDDRLLLWDTGNWRINVYSPAGESVATWSTPSGMSGSSTATYSRALTVDTAGFVYFRRDIINRLQPGTRRTVWVRLRADGTLADTLPMPELPGAARALNATSPDGHSSVGVALPFGPVPVAMLSPFGYLVTGVPDRYSFELRVPGQPVLSVRRDVKPAPVTSAERDSAKNAVAERMRQVDPLWTWNGPGIPATKPLYESLAIGADGRIWVPIVPESSPRTGSTSSMGPMGASRGGGPPVPRPRESPAKEIPSRPALFDVFEANGTYVGQVQVPPRVSTAVRRGDYVWGVAFGEDDVASVKRYRIVWR